VLKPRAIRLSPVTGYSEAMMATTHVFAGALAGVLALAVAPEYAGHALVAGAVGGVVPDLDLYAGHRRTLHFPVYGTLAAAVALAAALLFPGPGTVATAAFLGAAALHAASDALGGGLELRPWEGTSERAVYDHFRGVWIRPRRWVRYDGAPEDAALGAVLAAPTLLAFGPGVRPAIAALLCVSVAYAVLRKPMVALAERLVARLPSDALDALPERFLSDLR
jgi:hypothetical protein